MAAGILHDDGMNNLVLVIISRKRFRFSPAANVADAIRQNT